MAVARNIRYTFRSLGKSPGFAATAIVTLALGIGATAAIFSVCDAMLWKPVPLPHMDSLAMVLQRDPGNPNDWEDATPADIDDIRAQSASYADLASYQQGLANIASVGGEPERVNQALVATNFFDVLGVQPESAAGFAPAKTNRAMNGKSSSAIASGSAGSAPTATSSAPPFGSTTRITS